MEDSPLVSVIIPCYNSEEWIDETLESVFNQSYQNFAIIIVDDGSTDSTKKVVDKYIRENRVRYYYQENKGPAAARNLGIKKATSKYIAFLDSDDLWEEEKLAKQIQFLRKNPEYKLVLSNVTVINQNGELLKQNFNQVPKERTEIIRSFFLEKIVMNTPTIVANREAVLEVGGFDEELSQREDHLFLMNMADKFKIKHFAECLVKRRIREGSISRNLVNSNNPKRRIEVQKEFINKSLKSYPFLKKDKALLLSVTNRKVSSSYWELKQRNESIKFALTALKYKPCLVKNIVLLLLLLLPFSYRYVKRVRTSIKEQLGLEI